MSSQRGAHFLRTGVEYRRYLTNGISSQGEQGSYVSSGNLSAAGDLTTIPNGIGLSVAELEFGALSSGSQTQNADFAARSDFWAGYLQDDWRVSKKLTLNVGLRYEYERPLAERNGKEIVAFDFGAANSTTAKAATAYNSIAGTDSLLPASINPTGGAIFDNTDGYNRNPYQAPQHEVIPRVGFAYAATQRTVLRGGYGLFFDSLVSYYLSGGNGGSSTTFIIPQQGYSATSNVAAPTFTNAGGLAFTSTLANPFPSGLTPVSGSSLGTSTALGQSIQFLYPHPNQPYSERWSIGLQQQIGSWVASVDYVGNHGVHLPTGQISQGTNTGGREFDNMPRQFYSTVTNGYDNVVNTAESLAVTNPFSGLIPAGAANNLATSKVAVSQLQRPYPEFASINAFTTDGVSNYSGLQALLQRRFTAGLSFTGAFTWQRLLDGTTFLNPVDTKPWYGVSANDRPLRFSTSAIYQLPWGRGRRWLANSHGVVAQVVGGWQAQGVYQIQSGAPLTFTRNDIYLGTNAGDSHWSRGSYKSTINATGIGNWFNTSQWLNTSAASTAPNAILTCPATQAFCPHTLPGSLQLRTFPLRFNTLRSDNLNQADVGVQREFSILELGVLQFRAEAINVLNHPVYSAPSTDPTNAQFAQILSQANQPRVFQFAGFFRF